MTHLPNRKTVVEFLFVLLGALVFFSYFPLINFGAVSGMNLDVSLVEIGLLLFVLVGLPDIWKARKKLVTRKSVWITGLFVLWNLISLIWTSNLARGALTVGLVGLLWLAFLWVHACLTRKLFEKFSKAIIWAGVVVGIFALWQMLGSALGASQAWTSLCNTCQADIFGFARPNGFAIEPQFLGNLLLAPILLLAIYLLSNAGSKKAWIVFSFLSLVLFLTMSRGAIYAFVIAGVILCIISWKKWKKLLQIVGAVGGAFVLGLLVQGLMTQINPRVSDNFVDGVAKSTHQMSMGLIDFRPKKETTEDSAELDGYVEESTDIRLSLSDMAFETITASTRNFVFGVGVGGTGTAFAEQFGTREMEIAQNEYFEIWVELGIIGFAIFVAMLVGWAWKTQNNRVFWVILAAYGVQWVFFSGYPNALHIYLVLGILFVFSSSRQLSAKMK